jgi:hypothetical protein
MIFAVQVCAPEIVPGRVEEEAQDLSDALTLVYLPGTERLVLSFNHVLVGIDYQDEVDVFIEDVVHMLKALRNPEVADWRLSFDSQSFDAIWNIRVVGDDLVIDSEWEAIPGGYEFLLNERSGLTVKKEFFVAEWTKLLRKVVEDVEMKGVRMESALTYATARDLLS